jgi:hypothetical protein
LHSETGTFHCAVGVLIAVFLVAERLLKANAAPIGFHFVGHDHGERGTNAGAHFGAMSHDDNRAVRVQTYKEVGIPGGFGNFSCRVSRLGHGSRSEDQRAGGEEAAEEVTAGGEFDSGAHAFTPAAVLMAARMR